MGAVKRTHKYSRVKQQEWKDFRKLCQQNPAMAANKWDQFVDSLTSAIQNVMEYLRPVIEALGGITIMSVEQTQAELRRILEKSRVEDPAIGDFEDDKES